MAARLQQLGAITQGDRRANSNSGISAFTIDPHYGKEALSVLLMALATSKPPREVPDFLDESYAGSFPEFAETAWKALTRAGVNLEKFPDNHTFLNKLLGN